MKKSKYKRILEGFVRYLNENAKRSVIPEFRFGLIEKESDDGEKQFTVIVLHEASHLLLDEQVICGKYSPTEDEAAKSLLSNMVKCLHIDSSYFKNRIKFESLEELAMFLQIGGYV